MPGTLSLQEAGVEITVRRRRADRARVRSPMSRRWLYMFLFSVLFYRLVDKNLPTESPPRQSVCRVLTAETLSFTFVCRVLTAEILSFTFVCRVLTAEIPSGIFVSHCACASAYGSVRETIVPRARTAERGTGIYLQREMSEQIRVRTGIDEMQHKPMVILQPNQQPIGLQMAFPIICVFTR